jgi:hypothetical protein
VAISHSKMQAPTGNRQVVNSQSGLSDTHPLFVELLQWSSEQKEPQELEVLLYPVFEDQALDPAAPTLPTFFCTRLELAWSGGAGGDANAQRHSTTTNVPAGVGVSTSYQDRDLPIQALPDHGMRIRMACRDLRVRMWVAASPASFVIVGSIQPCLGGRADVVPPVMLLGLMPQVIPIGAREFRVAPYPRNAHAGNVPDPTLLIQFNECRVPSILGTEQIYVASDCTDWRTIPGEAYSVQTLAECVGTIEYR